MECMICGNDRTSLIYKDLIRDGAFGKMTTEPVEIIQCDRCKTIFHKPDIHSSDLYQSGEYRQRMGECSRLTEFYKYHDAESLEKFRYTGTEIFRDKIVADIGCGGGAYMDYINTVARQVICIEPDAAFREAMKSRRGYEVYPCLADALKGRAGKVDVAVSFDCIEHVDDPLLFLRQAWDLLNKNDGVMIIGTPTDAPVMRDLLGSEYEAFLFSTQHPWILGKSSFEHMVHKAGITNYGIKFYQRYGLGNALHWLIEKEPSGHASYDFISESLNALWKHELERQELADYIVFEARKQN